MCVIPTTSTSSSSTTPIAPSQPAKTQNYKKTFLLSKLTQEIQSFANNDHQKALEKAEKTVKSIFEKFFPETQVWSTGSFPAGVDLVTSDLDMTVKVPKIPGVEGSQMGKLMKMKEVLTKLDVFSKCYVQKARVSVLQLVDRETGVEIDVTVDSEDGKRNTQLLVLYGQVDPRFPLLCRAIKAWAGAVGVEGSKHARLNSFSVCLLVASYLQVGVSPPILPNLQELFPELNGEMEVENDRYSDWRVVERMEDMGVRMERNDASLGELYLGFMEYYSRFDFNSNWISIRQAKVLPKRWDSDNLPLDGMPIPNNSITIQDPFYNRNCASSVYDKPIALRLAKEFKISVDRIKKTKTMFGLLKSGLRRKIDSEGMKRDLLIEKWKLEIEQEKRKNAPSEEELPWGSVTEWEDMDWTKPFDDYEHPKVFWDLEGGRKEKVEPWPVPAERIFCDFEF